MLNIALGYDITSRNWDNTDVDVNITDPDGFNGIKDIDNNNTSFSEGTLTDVVAVNGGLELKNNYALSFDGINDYVAVNNFNDYGNETYLEIECSIYLEENNSEVWVIWEDWQYDISEKSVMLRVEPDRTIRFFVSSDGSNEDNATTIDTVPLNTWSTIKVVFDSGDVEIFLNQNSILTDTLSETSLYISNNIKNIAFYYTPDIYSSFLMNSFKISTSTGLVLEYNFDTGSGTTLFDSTGTNDGTINGATWIDNYPTSGNRLSPTIDLSPIGSVESSIISWESLEGLSFDGIDDLVNIPHSELYNFENDDSFSYSILIKLDEAPSSPAYFLSKTTIPGYVGTGFGIGDYYSESQLRVFLTSSASDDLIKDYNYPQEYQNLDKAWLTVTYDGTKSYEGLNLYCNGDLLTGDNIRNTLTGSTKNTEPIVIGSDLKCSIEELRIWNTEITQAEIQNNMYSELAGAEAGLVAYYKFD